MIWFALTLLALGIFLAGAGFALWWTSGYTVDDGRREIDRLARGPRVAP
jgi:hypothetical protein